MHRIREFSLIFVALWSRREGIFLGVLLVFFFSIFWYIFVINRYFGAFVLSIKMKLIVLFVIFCAKTPHLYGDTMEMDDSIVIHGNWNTRLQCETTNLPKSLIHPPITLLASSAKGALFLLKSLFAIVKHVTLILKAFFNL